MVILGLTCGIAMGKSVAAATFRRLGIPVHDSDAEVHRLLGPRGAAVPAVEAAFPGVTRNGAVDRVALGARVFGDAAALKRLERILHPLVGQRRDQFLRAAARRHARLVVLDIPLLFEVGANGLCDAIVVVSAPAFVQRQRALKRTGMTPARLDAILARQMADAEKRKRADFVVHSGRGRAHTLRQLRTIARVAQIMTGHHWPPR